MSVPCGRLSRLMSASERTLKQHLVSYHIAKQRGCVDSRRRGAFGRARYSKRFDQPVIQPVVQPAVKCIRTLEGRESGRVFKGAN